MQWTLTSYSEFKAYTRFVEKYEPLCMKIEEHLRKNGTWSYPPVNEARLFHAESDGEVKAVILVYRASQLFASAPEMLSESLFEGLLAIAQHELLTVDFVQLIPSCTLDQEERLKQVLLRLTPQFYSLSFYLMQSHFDLLNSDLKNDCLIKENDDNDLSQMKALHALYLQEEVANPLRPITEAEATRISLPLLRGETLWGLYQGKKLVSKANTNAVGLKTIQLGGIYTLPDFRGHHYSCRLLQYLSSRLMERGWNLSLFVKQDNTPALKVYEHCGFKKINTLTILYGA